MNNEFASLMTIIFFSVGRLSEPELFAVTYNLYVPAAKPCFTNFVSRGSAITLKSDNTPLIEVAIYTKYCVLESAS